MNCSVDNCKREDIAARELCWPHYQRWRRNGRQHPEENRPVRVYKKTAGLPKYKRLHPAYQARLQESGAA